MRVAGNFRIDTPSFPLYRAQVTYEGITDAVGDAFGTTLIDSLCSTVGQQSNYAGQTVKLMSGNAAGQVREIAIHNIATGTITVAAPWTDFNGVVYQVPASTRFTILSGAGGGGAPPPPPVPPEVGLWMFGHCSPAMVASPNTIVCPNLAGFGDDTFNNEFWMQAIQCTVAATERQIRRITDYVSATGTFTVDPFSTNVSPGDEVAIFHESIMGIEIMGFGTLDTLSATVPADSTRAAAYAYENNNYFSGALLVLTEGNCRMQARRIVGYTAVGGIFTIDPSYPFSQVPAPTAPNVAVDYIIVSDQCGWEWPYIQGTLSYMDGPDPNQADIEICRLSLHNLRVNGGLIPVADFTGTPLIDIDRYRWGVDAAWTASPVVGVAMAEAAGYANYAYTWPAPFWQVADFFRITVRGTIVTIPPGSVQTIYIPPQTVYGVVGGLSNIKKKVNLIFDIVNAILKLTETGGSITPTDATENTVYINDDPLGVYEPRKVKIDCSNMAWGDIVVLRWYERLNNGGGLILKDEWRLEDVQDPDLGKPPIKNIELEPNRFGVHVTLAQIAGTYRSFDWEVFYAV